MTTRPQKVTNLRDAENKRINTWIPSNGTGIGLWRGRRVYYVNGKRQSGLTIRNPMGDSIAKGLYTMSGVRSIVENPGSLGIIDPRVWQAALRIRQSTKLNKEPSKKQSKEVLERIAQNQAKLMTEGFGTGLDAESETSSFENRITSDRQTAKEVIKQDKENLKIIKNQLTNPKDINKASQIEQIVEDNNNKVDSGFPAEVSEVEKQKGRTRWVGANTTWKDRWGNVIAPKVKAPTKEEQKRIIMTSLEQEMYD